MISKEIIQSTFEKADEHLDRAQEQYCKPKEDLVPYMICRSAYFSVANYLAAYLRHNNFEVKREMSLEFLLNACRELDPKFKELNLDQLFYGASHQEDAVVASQRIINEYLKLATQTRDLIARDLT